MEPVLQRAQMMPIASMHRMSRIHSLSRNQKRRPLQTLPASELRLQSAGSAKIFPHQVQLFFELMLIWMLGVTAMHPGLDHEKYQFFRNSRACVEMKFG
jgi:hypothetical protein